MSQSRTHVLVIGCLFCLSIGVSPAAERLSPDYWRQPLAPQGEAPRIWTPEERSLAPESCGVCHGDKLEEWRTSLHARAFSPGVVGQSDTTAPHGGVTRVPEFEKSEFCAACHQFPQSQAINGKPLENTLVEWEQSPAARSGVTCQSCHMPERKHLWRGIHDPDMVRSGLTPEFVAEPQAARFRLTSTGIGHAFPTYVTPKVIMKAIALDETGRPIPGSEVGHVIQRQVEFVDDDWIERADTRLLPGQSATLEISWPKSSRVKFWLEVQPDDFYHRHVYPNLLDELAADSSAAKLIAEANRLAQASHFSLFETVVQRP